MIWYVSTYLTSSNRSSKVTHAGARHRCPPFPQPHSKIFKRKIEKEKTNRCVWNSNGWLLHPPPKKIAFARSSWRRDPPTKWTPTTASRRSTVSCAGSWWVFRYDRIFCSMIIGQEMAEIRHGGGCRTVPFLEVVRCGRFLETERGQKNSKYLRFQVFKAGSLWGVGYGGLYLFFERCLCHLMENTIPITYGRWGSGRKVRVF